ncbi:MAG: ion channel [Planctomycetota bacterium]
MSGAATGSGSRAKRIYLGLGLLVLHFAVAPMLFAAPGSAVAILSFVGLQAALVLTLCGLSGVRWMTGVGMGLVLASGFARLAPWLEPEDRSVLGSCLSALVLAIVGMRTAKSFFDGRSVTPVLVSSAVSLYLLSGFFFTLCFDTLETWSPCSFLVGGVAADPRDLHYFSYTTLTTLGYGDVTPHSEVARILALSEAVFGQMFVALVLGRLVGLQVASQTERGPTHSR